LKVKQLSVSYIRIAIIYSLLLKSPSLSITQVKEKYDLDGEGVSIAILDTGLDMRNREISFKKGKGFTSGNNGIQDTDGHGTFITSLISSSKFGLAPKADIYVAKVLESSNKGEYIDIVSGIEWAIKEDVDIILMSLGGKKYSKNLEIAIEKASNKGIVIVSAIGNDGLSVKDTVNYPAKFNQVLGVGAINEDNRRWFKSSRGVHIDVMTQGENIEGYSLNGKTQKSSGTSVAAAMPIN